MQPGPPPSLDSNAVAQRGGSDSSHTSGLGSRSRIRSAHEATGRRQQQGIIPWVGIRIKSPYLDTASAELQIISPVLKYCPSCARSITMGSCWSGSLGLGPAGTWLFKDLLWRWQASPEKSQRQEWDRGLGLFLKSSSRMNENPL